MTNQITFGNLQPYYDSAQGKAYPEQMSGLAEQGKQVYQDLGCMYCHSQQVRREGFGDDIERGWGKRQSVARDYVRDGRVFLGTMRTGPDLRNVVQRLSTAEWHLRHLYSPQMVVNGSIMPPFPFLFEKRKIVGEPSAEALKLSGKYAPPPGYEIVPTHRAEALVAYLLSLKTPYDVPEAGGKK